MKRKNQFNFPQGKEKAPSLSKKQTLTLPVDEKGKLRYPPSTFFDIKISDENRLLTKKEIADFLNVSIKMIDRKVLMNEIPYLKVGKLVRFSKSRVLAWAEESIPKE